MKNLITNTIFFCVFVFFLYLITIYKMYSLDNGQYNLLLISYSVITSVFLLSRFPILIFYSDKHTAKFSKKDYPNVSAVVACKNEEDSIYKTIETIFESEYPGELDCVVVDDGSTDRTYQEMMRAKKKFGTRLKVVKFKENLGKREGMSEGVLASQSEIIVFVDSDSFVKKDGIRLIVEHFIGRPEVGAVSGNSGVENVETNMLTKMQQARYEVSFDVFKACESVFGNVTCCPGCFSAYRRSAIIKIMDRWRNQSFLGTKSTFGDDRSLTNYVLENNKVLYCQS